VGAFRRVHPRVYINLLVFNTGYAEKLILDGQMDIGFVEGPLSKNKELRVHPWFQDELVILVGATDPLAHNDVFDVKRDIKGPEMDSARKGVGNGAIFREKMKEYFQDISVVMEMGHPEAIKRAVEAGAGIACLSALCICREVENGWLKSLQVEGIDMKRQLQIISRIDKEISDAHAEFLNFCDVMSTCNDESVCLSSPWKLQSMLARHSSQKKQESGVGSPPSHFNSVKNLLQRKPVSRGGRTGCGSVPCQQDLSKAVHRPLPPADLEQRPHQIANHLTEKSISGKREEILIVVRLLQIGGEKGPGGSPSVRQALVTGAGVFK